MGVHMKKIIKFCKCTIITSPFFFSLNVLVLLIFALAQLGMMLSFKLITDSILSTQNIGKIDSNIILTILFFFLMICIGGNTSNLNDMMTTLFTNKSKKLFHKLFLIRSKEEKQDSFYNSAFYDNYSFVKKNIESTTGVSVTLFNRFIGAFLTLLVSTLSITVFSPIILLFIVLVSITMILINSYVVKKRVLLNEKYVNCERKAAYYSELLSGKNHAKELRVFHLRQMILDKWSNSFHTYTKEKYEFEKKSLFLSNVPELMKQILSPVMTIYFLYLVWRGEMTVGEFTFLFGMMWNLMWGISNIMDILSRELVENCRYIDKYEEFVGDIDPKKVDNEHNTCSSYELSKGAFEEISFENVSYTYPNQEEAAVKNLNLKIHKGEVVSLLGYNGSGKSTLSKLLCGILEDYEGVIKLNGINVREIPKEELYLYFGIGFQEFTRYSISLKENVGFGMIEKLTDEEQLQKAYKKGNLQEVISHLPNGEHTLIGKEFDSNGQELSGGQWQRIILSRAYMGEPEFLILDEPTASIDPLEEMRMLEHFKQIVEEKTALLISHRIGFARISDRICVMENGRLIEDGTHEDLMKKHGNYYKLFTSQQELYGKELMSYVG